MAKNYDLSGHKVAVISATSDSDRCRKICHYLQENKAHVAMLAPEGVTAMEDCGDEQVSFEEAKSNDYDSLLMITDEQRIENLMNTVNADRFVNNFFTRKRPVSALGASSLFLGQIGLLEGREVSIDDDMQDRVRRNGATVSSDEMTTDEGMTTAKSTVDTMKFAQKVAEEVEEGRHAGQHA